MLDSKTFVPPKPTSSTPALGRTLALSLALVVGAVGCAGMGDPQSRAREAATELNLNSRFDRTQLVIDRVAAKARKDFTRTHRAWGGEVRVTDAEVAGFHMTSDTEAEVNVRVAWFRLNEGELRSTTLRQKFQDNKGSWLLVSEERVEGDVGLLGEHIERAAGPDVVPVPAQFPTIRIGEND
jgi:hypothetical protein